MVKAVQMKHFTIKLKYFCYHLFYDTMFKRKTDKAFMYKPWEMAQQRRCS